MEHGQGEQGAGAQERHVHVCAGYCGSTAARCRQARRDAAWSVVLVGGLLGPFIDFQHLCMLDRINRSLRALHAEGWRQAWEGFCMGAGSGQVKRILREASAAGGAKHVKILLQHVVAQDETALVSEDLGRACLCGSASKGHMEVVKVLLEVGGRDLAMLVAGNGESCLHVSAQFGHVEVVKVLLEVGGRDLAMLVREDGASCLHVSASKGHVEVVKVLLEVGGRDLAMLVKADGSTCFDAAARGGIGVELEVACKRAGMSEEEIADM